MTAMLCLQSNNVPFLLIVAEQLFKNSMHTSELSNASSLAMNETSRLGRYLNYSHKGRKRVKNPYTITKYSK